ncbi:HEAT repeat domain-containing protein [bacterium]|nr:HEAT repeat domain-containing protein [bacterium]
MSKILYLLLLVLVLLAPLTLVGDAIEDSKKPLDSTSFIKAVTNADAIFFGRYVQGGRTKARINVTDVIVGTPKGDIILTGFQNEIIRTRYNMPKFKKNSFYLFFAKQKGKNYEVIPCGITVPMMGDKLTFSFITPYRTNFWQPISTKLVKVAISAIREKHEGMLSEETQLNITKMLDSFIKKGDKNSIKALLSIARYVALNFPEDMYTPLMEGNSSVACLAVRFSAQIQGEIFFNDVVLPKIKDFSPDGQVAAAYAAVDADSKAASVTLGKLLNTVADYQPPSSECFPEKSPPMNKAVFVTSVIEIDAPNAKQVLKTQLLSGDATWLSILLNIMSAYEGADLIELVLQANAQVEYSAKKLEFNNYFVRIKSPATAKILIKLFPKQDGISWKKIVLGIIGLYEYPETTPFLIKVLNADPREEVRTTAAIAIGQLNQKEGIKPLFEFIMREKSLLAQSIAVDSLAKINNKTVQDYLKKIIKLAPDPKIRESAANAIEDNLFILRYGRKKQR